MNTRAKGAKFVKEAIAYFESKGYWTWQPGNKAIFIGPGRVVSGHQDIGDCFDFMAWGRGELYMVQVKSDNDKDPYTAMKLINEHHFPACMICVVLSRQNKQPMVFKTWVRLLDGNWTKPFIVKPND